MIADSSDCSADIISSYDINFRISGLFVVLVTSFAGIALATIVNEYVNSPEYGWYMTFALEMMKFFGIGVMAGTAWIHLLPDAFSQFSSNCLGDGWITYGSNYVGLFGVIATFLVQQLEFVLTQYGAHAHSHEIPPPKACCVELTADRVAPEIDVSVDVSMPRTSPTFDLPVDNPLPFPQKVLRSNSFLLSMERKRNAALAVALLELGILVHSFVIGLTLGVIDDAVYTALLIAITFHQFFEGLSLGALISVNEFPDYWHKTALCLMYPLTTPLGNAVGIAIRYQFNANSSSTIVTQGILSSLSAGILFYNTYTELIAVEINGNRNFRAHHWIRRYICFFSMYLGAATFAVIGIWA